MRKWLCLTAAGIVAFGVFPAFADTLLATYKKLDLKAYALGEGKAWCSETVRLRYDVARAQIPTEVQLDEFTRKLGPLITRECPKATSLSVEGRTNDGKIAYAGTSRKSAGWQLATMTPPTPPAQVALQQERERLLSSLKELAKPTPLPAPAPPKTPTPGDANTTAAPSPPPPVPGGGAITSKTTSPKPAQTADVLAKLEQLSKEASKPDGQKGDKSPEGITVGRLTLPSKNIKFVKVAATNEVDIATKDRACTLYHSTDRPYRYNGANLDLGSVGCNSGRVHGQGTLSIILRDGRKQRLSGAFSHGFFTSNRLWETPFLFRKRGQRDVEEVLFWADTDKTLKAHFLARLTPTRGRWAGCINIPMVEIVTEDAVQFRDSSKRQVLIGKATDVLRSVCPNAQSGVIRAVSDPSQPIPIKYVVAHQPSAAHMLYRADVSFKVGAARFSNEVNYVKLRDEWRDQNIKSELVSCNQAYVAGRHEAVKVACQTSFIKGSAEASAVIAKSEEREEQRVAAIPVCEKAFKDDDDPIEGHNAVLKDCRTDLLRGVEPALTVITKSQKRLSVFQEKIAARERRHQGLITEHRRLKNKWSEYKNEYDSLKEVSTIDRLKRALGLSQLHNPQVDTTNSLLGGEPIKKRFYVIHIKGMNGDIGTIDWPYPMKTDGGDKPIDDEGWYVVRADLIAEPEPGEKGFPVSRLRISDSYKCSEDACGEFKDSANVIRKRYKTENWSPDGPPEEPNYNSILAKEFPNLVKLPLSDDKNGGT